MKKIILRIGVVLAVLVLAVLLIVFFSINIIVKKGVETVGPRLTKVEMRLDSADISPFSGSGKLSGLFVGNPQGFKTPSAITVGSVKVAVQVTSVLSHTIVIDQVNVQAPDITLEGSFSGNNLTTILNNLSAATGGGEAASKTSTPAPTATNAAAATPAPAAASGSEKKFILKDLVIDGGKISLSMEIPGLKGKAATIPMVPIHIQNIGVAEGGVTANELALAIMKPLVNSVLGSAEKGVADLGGDVNKLGKQGVNDVKQAGQGLLDLFKK